MRRLLLALPLATLLPGALAAQQFGVIPKVVDTLWFALIGSTITVSVGEASARMRGSRGVASAHGPGGRDAVA